MKTIPQTIMDLLIKQEYIDSAEQFKVIDDWHYEMFGDLKLWLRHERHMADLFDGALEEEGYNLHTTVRLTPKDDEWFCIDLSKHENPPYYLLLTYDRHYDSYDKDILVTRDKKEAYLPVVNTILSLDTDSWLDWMHALLEDEFVEDLCNNDYSILEIHPMHLLHNGYIVTEYLSFEEVQYIDLPDFDEAEDPEEAREEFFQDLYDEDKYLFYLHVNKSE